MWPSVAITVERQRERERAGLLTFVLQLQLPESGHGAL